MLEYIALYGRMTAECQLDIILGGKKTLFLITGTILAGAWKH